MAMTKPLSEQVRFTQAGAGAVERLASEKLKEWVSVKDFGAVGDGITDDTAAINAAFNALKAAGGGDLIFPTGDYRFNLDVSGVNPHMQWIGQGSVTFRPYLATPDREWIIFADNKTPGVTGSAYGTNITFRNITFTGRFVGDVDPNYGRIGSCAWLQSSWAAFYNCAFMYGINSGFYGMFGQYNEFYECTFGANVTGAASTGCLLDSNTDGEAANENRLINCRFNTNKNGLVIKGGLGNRIVGCQFQNTIPGGLGALVLLADSTGFGTTNNWISGNYFEINSRDVHIEAAPGQTFEGNIFLPGTIYTTHCFDLRFIGNTSYGGAAITDFNHPAGNTDVAALTWIGNNFDPDIAGLTHVGPTRLNIENAQTRQRRNDNLLTSTGQTAGLAANFIPDWCGVKEGVPRATATDIFKLVQEPSVTATSRVAVFTVELFLWDDTPIGSQYGYSGHTQRFSVLIGNTSTGAPQAFIVQETSGVDLGLDTGFQSPGAVTLTSTVSGDSVTFRSSWSGSGTGAGDMTRQAVSYIVRGAVTNGFSMVRL